MPQDPDRRGRGRRRRTPVRPAPRDHRSPAPDRRAGPPGAGAARPGRRPARRAGRSAIAPPDRHASRGRPPGTADGDRGTPDVGRRSTFPRRDPCAASCPPRERRLETADCDPGRPGRAGPCARSVRSRWRAAGRSRGAPTGSALRSIEQVGAGRRAPHDARRRYGPLDRARAPTAPTPATRRRPIPGATVTDSDAGPAPTR